jgi:hypothetical protein
MTIVHISPEQPSVGDTLTVELDILEVRLAFVTEPQWREVMNR